VHKWNTFFDFKDCAEHLIAQGTSAMQAVICAQRVKVVK
jgi:protease II